MKSKNIAILFAGTILLLVLSSWLLGCATIHKVFHKDKSRIDSTSVTHERKDSVAEIDSTHLNYLKGESENEIVVDWGDKGIVKIPTDSKDSGIYKTNSGNWWMPSDSAEASWHFFEITKEGTIRTNVVPKSVTIKGKQATEQLQVIDDHSKITLSDVKDDSKQVKTVERKVEKEIKKTVFEWWWFLLIIPAYLIYRNRKGIWAFAVHLFTGL